MIFHVPIATYYTNQAIPFAYTKMYIYIYISHWSIIYLSLQCHCLYHWRFMYLCIYIYIARWLIVGLPFIYQYICIYHYTLYPQYTIIYTSVYHIGLPLAYTLHPKKNPHNILHCIPNIPIYIYLYTSVYHIGLPLAYTLYPKKIIITYYIVSPIYCFIYIRQYITLAYHWLIHCIPKKIIYYIVSPICRYIHIYIHISISHWLTIGLYIVSQKKP